MNQQLSSFLPSSRQQQKDSYPKIPPPTDVYTASGFRGFLLRRTSHNGGGRTTHTHSEKSNVLKPKDSDGE